MNFLEALAATDHRRKICRVQEWLNSLDPETQRQIADAIKETNANRVFKACKLIGMEASLSLWEKHQVGGCACKNA